MTIVITDLVMTTVMTTERGIREGSPANYAMELASAVVES